MAAYLIGQHKVTDQAAFEEFRRKAVPMIEGHGGRFIVRSQSVEVLDGEWAPNRVVVIEFSDMAKLRSVFEAPEFQELAELRREAGTGVVLAIEGA